MLFLAAVARTLLHDTFDPDAFWHLRVADQIAAAHSPSNLVDDLSFSSIHQPWTPYSWLAELGMKSIWDLGGYRLALVAQLAITGGFILFLALIGLEFTLETGPPRYLNAALATLIGEILSLPYLSFRPVTFAFLLLAAAVWLLQRDRRLNQRSHAVWLLIPLAAVLINIHFFAFFLPASVFALLIGEIVKPSANRFGRCVRRYAMLAVATSLTCCATPLLGGVLKAAAWYQFSDVMVASGAIAEMKPFYSASPFGFVAVALVLLVVGGAVLNRRRVSVGHWLWIIGSLLVLFRLGRFLPIFCIFAVPGFAATAPYLRDRNLARPLAVALIAVMVCLFTFNIMRAFPSSRVPFSTWLNRLDRPDSAYPTAAADFVDAHVTPRTHHLVNEFTWGGYLEWRFAGRYQAFLDGRTQLFTPGFWRSVYLAGPDARKDYLAHVSADAAILPAESSVFAITLHDLGWTVAYHDSIAQVLIPPTEN